MATLNAKGLGVSFGARTLFSGLDLIVAEGDIVGLVGANGAGKSTLLRILAGLITPDDGQVTLAPASALVGYLPQEPQRIVGETVRGYLARRTGVTDAQTRLDRAIDALSTGDEIDGVPADDAYNTALEEWLALGGADLDERVPQVAASVQLQVDLDAPMTSLSGGEAARAGLAALMLSRYDIYLLDEPTNDLDLAGLELLEQFVTSLRAGAVIVSHDREFLARTVNRVVELDLAQQLIRQVNGGYAAYLEERRIARRARPRRVSRTTPRPSISLQARSRMQRGWSEQGARNALRKAPDNDKILRNLRAGSSEKQAAKARQTDRMIERLDVVEEPRKEWQLKLEIATAPRAGAVVAALQGAVVRRGDFELGPVDLQIDWADRVSITGPNGAGKSTLLGALLGRVPLAAGTSYVGPGVVIGEIDQARSLFTGSGTLLRAFGATMPDWPEADVRTLLAKFGLELEPRPAAGRGVVARRTHPRRAGVAAGPRGQPAGLGRAHEPSRPARDRAARTGAGVLPRHAAVGHARPAAARRGVGQPPHRSSGRPGRSHTPGFPRKWWLVDLRSDHFRGKPGVVGLVRARRLRR